MKTNCTELVFILDRSGSMAGLESDTIGGFNAMLSKQKEAQGEAIITTVLFNDEYELLHDCIHVNGVAPLTTKDYEVGGTTALLDAIGLTIQKIKKAQKATMKEACADKVLFVITTDGMENSSQEYNYKKIKALIEQQKEVGWEFIFLGANIDAIGMASKMGIDQENAVEYHADEIGTQVNFQAVSETVLNYRKEGKLNRSWKKEIETDFKSRK
ncbi:vWA domain-containing protein [Lysinibacillus antri]|uniref:VWA domain-containing protein n=1 Tax=Lysinibacillus antri TaxID=2498145 RepID=A0A3S0WF50_9BACI|nr:vWA domain-containing protein [Lysinibacillus antri]RUL49819.1 VWA domain-containing protein [Lysinibacillus antri]